MNGLMVFTSMREALDAGFQICERTECGYLVRCKTPNGWAKAIVQLKAGC